MLWDPETFHKYDEVSFSQNPFLLDQVNQKVPKVEEQKLDQYTSLL